MLQHPQGKSYKGKTENLTGGKKRQLNDMNTTDNEEFKQLKTWRKIQGKYGNNPPMIHKGEEC